MREASLPETAVQIEGIADSMHRHVARELKRFRIASRSAASRTDLGNAVNRVAAVLQKTTAHEPLRWEVERSGDIMVAAEMEDLFALLDSTTKSAARHARR